MSTVEVTKENFKDTIAEGVVFLDFWAPWCGPCRQFGPVFEKASEAHPDVVFGKVNTDDQPELGGAFQIMSIPTLMVFRDGIQVFQQPGALSKPALEELITNALALDMEEVRKKVEEAAAEQA